MDSRFEFVIVLGGNGSRAIGTREFRGMVHNVYTGSPQRHNENADLHAATFPPDLPQHFITTFTNEGETIYEPFCGTGTTLLVCQNTGRIGRGVELSPAYVAVALQRMQDAFPALPIRRVE
jgi:DNA modification methylase